MKKTKKIIKGLAFPLAMAGLLCSGGFLLHNNFDQISIKSCSADFSVVETLENDVPEYLQVVPQNEESNKLSYANDNLFLFQAQQYFDLKIATTELEGSGYSYDPDSQTDKLETGTNYAYLPQSNNDQNFYYFDFQSTLSLYYNLTWEDVKSGLTNENLIKDQNISNYAKYHENCFTPNDTSFVPQQFDIQFKLDLLQQDISFDEKTVTLTDEGCYTLVIPVVEYYTSNGGASWTAKEENIYYTFMAFNANTYFDSTTGKPKLTTSENLHQTLLGSSSSEFSSYYYYNFGYGDKVNTLPEITYKPSHYQVEIEWTDIDAQTKSVFVQYQNDEIVQLDKNGQPLNESEEFVKVRKNGNGTATITFYDIGSYDINISYLWTLTNDNGSVTFNLPFENLKPEENNTTIFKNKAQRLYIYGYQAVYSDYSKVNPETNQPENVDLKTYDFENGKYYNSADITSLINNKAGLENTAQSGNFNDNTKIKYKDNEYSFAEGIKAIIDGEGIKPISTNQTPVKFLSNAKNSEVSEIYTKTSAGWSNTSTNFQGFNENNAGTYLYIVQYTFDSYMSTSGTLQSSHYHYQIFYFTITNTSPTVDVIELDENYSDVWTNGFTNKSVYILNNAENSNYDAEVTITLSAKNYKTGSYYFKDENIKNLSSYGINYQQFIENTEQTDNEELANQIEAYNNKIANKYGVLIENTNKYANAEWTIKIYSQANNNDDKNASVRKFTIDTNEISNITARNVSVQNSTTYNITNGYNGFATNTPFVLSWEEKLSGAKTYGYVKYVPTTAINYYSSLDDNNLAELLSRLIDSHDTLPVSNKIDISGASTSTWTEYSNSYNFTNSVPSSYVKSSDGFYILEVYDQAGNVTFDIFLLDSSAPIFIEELIGDTTTQKILSNSESLNVPENDVDVIIKWTSNKAIYLENMTAEILNNVQAYPYGVDVQNANIVLKEKLNSFFNTSNQSIQYFNDITAETTNQGNEDGLVPTGLASFNGNYLIIPINDRVYIKEGNSSNFAPFDTSSYRIKFFDDNGELIADNKTYKILLRDQSNTKTSSIEEDNFKNNPSGYISFNVTSDASKLTLKAGNSPLEFSSFDLTGLLYSYLDKDGNILYTHIADEDAVNEEGEKIYSETNLGYKFSYYTPINGKKELQLSYIPVAKNGSKLEKVELKYYPFVLTSTTYENNPNRYYYYDIAQEPTKTINVFTVSDKTYDENQEVVFNVALGTDNYPLAGRYVVERTYLQNSTTDKYDYYKRTLTFTVDNFNLISPLESVTNGENSSLESPVGGEIILSMYSGAGNSAIQVAFPSYDANTGLSSGSFYTKDSFDSLQDNVTFAVEGNKLPMSIYIPKFKYTISSIEKTENNGTTYSVNKNDNLSYYGNAKAIWNDETKLWDVYVEGVVIQSFTTEKQAKDYINNQTTINEYQIYAKIAYNLGQPNEKFYYSNGNERGGYLNFYLGDADGNIIDKTKPVENFYLQGDYVVTIYQATNQGSQSDFWSFYKFGFKIKSQSPKFEVIGSNGYELNNTTTPNVYYSNSSELKIQWEVPASKFEAQIDETNILIKTPSSSYYYQGEILGTTTRYFTLDTTELLNTKDSYIEITMQYYGHSKDYYETIKKTIYFDKSAPTQNLQSLMTLTENATLRALGTNYQLMFMRKYADYDGNEMQLTSLNDVSNVSYSYSMDTGYFKYYSYNVTTSFFHNTLLQTIERASSNPHDTQFVYYKAIENIDNYTQVDKASFSAGNYYYITTDRTAKVTCGYYEIVEMDYAGNMTVYLVYLIDSTDSEDENVRTDALSYTNSRTVEEEVVTDSEIVNGFNIYSTSNFELKSLNYKSDPWAFMTVQIAGKSEQRFLKSPWLSESQVYKITFTSSGITFNQVSLKSIFGDVESSANKHKITLTDRTVGTNQLIYLSIMDASLSPEKVEDPTKTSAILNISIPTPAQVLSTTTTYVYPVQIEIHQYDPNMAGDDNWQLQMIAVQNPYGTWSPASSDFASALNYISFTTLASGKTLQIKINLGANATQKVKYVITDNFGKVSTIIQLANEVGYREISGSSTIWTNYESDGTVTYLSDKQINYSYNVLLYSIEIFDINGLNITQTVAQEPNPATNITVVSLAPSHDHYYDDYYKIEVWDIESEAETPIKTIHIRLYNKLPFRTTNPVEVENGGIIFNDKNQQPIAETNITTLPSKTISYNGKTYTSSADAITTFSQNVTIRFKNGQELAFEGGFSYQDGYSYSVYLSRDNGLTWENINNTNSDTSGYTISGVGEYIVFIKYDSDEYFTNLCKIFTVSILDSTTSYYYITVDGLAVEKSDIKYLSLDNREYDVNYIVSVDYADKDNRLAITANEELNVLITRTGVDNTGSLVTVEIYHYECDEAVGDFTIIYIAETNNIVNILTYETASGSTTSIKDLSSEIVVANNETEPNFNKLKINFSSFYGIASNKINVEVLKLFNGAWTKIDSTVFTNGENSYIYLERAGSYRLKFYDSCSPMNVQTFKNSQYFEMIFLSHVPFVVTQTDSEGNESIFEPIQKAVYNGAVIIKPTNLATYYQTSGYPSISVKLNGHDYNGYHAQNRVYTFTTPGYYSVKFTAKSTTGIQVREEEFNFTIINPNESRDAFEWTRYDQYYIQQVIKNGVDITEDLLNITNFETITINGKKYLANLSVKHLDNKTGEGKYKLVINHNKPELSNILGNQFEFEFWINHVTNVPITISTSKGILKEGEKTSKDVTISFNVKNLYEAVGDCYIKVGEITKYYTAENIENYGVKDSLTIVDSGVYYVQVYTTGGKLLYSFKVVRTEPLNAFAVLAIVLGVIAVVAIVFITIKIRKRQKVK